MLKETDLYEDQAQVIDRLYNHDYTFLVAPMGAGKTVCAMTAAQEMLNEGHIKRVLVFAGQKVCNNVWRTEAQEWEHLKDLKVGIATGNEAQRNAVLHSDAQIVCTTFNNIPWFFDVDWRNEGFDALVIDELSKFSSNAKQGAWVKTLRKYVDTFKWRVGMTGTPVNETMGSLFYQMLIIDGGKTYGENKDKWLRKYFYPTDYEQRNWEVLPHMEDLLIGKIAHCIHVMPDYTHTLPPCVEHTVPVPMNEHTATMYRDMAKDMIVDVDGDEIIAKNAAVKSGKLEQIAQGFLYQGEGKDQRRVRIHDSKIDVCDALVDRSLDNGHNVIIVYQFKEDYEALIKIFPGAPALNGDTGKVEGQEAIKAWNEGLVPVMLLQPQSAGHGLNIAKGGHEMIFYMPVWSNDLTKQTIARLWRRGQKHQVNVWFLCMDESIDHVKMERVEYKSTHHPRLLNHLKKVIKNR